MPFAQQTQKPFNRLSVFPLREEQLGVYGIFNQFGRCLYIGKGEIRKRLLEHLDGDIPCIIHSLPKFFYAESCPNDMDEREKMLIKEFNPICNKRT